MSKCISSHGEYSKHEPGDPCPWCGEYDMPRIIAERDEARARIKAVRALLASVDHDRRPSHSPIAQDTIRRALDGSVTRPDAE